MPDFSNVQTERIQYLSIAACVLLIVVIIELIRRGRLREEYAIVWLGTAVVFDQVEESEPHARPAIAEAKAWRY